MDPRLVPGARVRHPSEPEWGVGHVQSVVGDRITVNFEDRGKVVINGGVISLEVIETNTRAAPPWASRWPAGLSGDPF